MTPQLEENLYLAFPTLFPRRKTRAEGGYDPFVLFGFAVGDGWYQIIWDAAAKISALSSAVHCVQIKEKFGGLRFYVEGAGREVGPEINEIIGSAELRSFETCEECGESGEAEASGWVKVLCPQHRALRLVSRETAKKGAP